MADAHNGEGAHGGFHPHWQLKRHVGHRGILLVAVAVAATVLVTAAIVVLVTNSGRAAGPTRVGKAALDSSPIPSSELVPATRSVLAAGAHASGNVAAPPRSPLSVTSSPVVPHSNPALNQYVEIVPTTTGGLPTASVAQQESGARPSVAPLPHATVRFLASQGRAGADAVKLAELTAPAGPSNRRGPAGAGGEGDTRPASGTRASDGVTSGVLKAFTGLETPGGLGVLLPGILVAVTLIVTVEVIAAKRRRRRSQYFRNQ